MTDKYQSDPHEIISSAFPQLPEEAVNLLVLECLAPVWRKNHGWMQMIPDCVKGSWKMLNPHAKAAVYVVAQIGWNKGGTEK